MCILLRQRSPSTTALGFDMRLSAVPFDENAAAFVPGVCLSSHEWGAFCTINEPKEALLSFAKEPLPVERSSTLLFCQPAAILCS